MEAIRIENLKSLKDTGQIPLKSMNILLGPNNSGKSTFLRVFPLLKQSIEVRTKGPILWYGDYVDFGNYATDVHKGASEIVFHFDVIIKGSKRKILYYYNRTPNFVEDKNIHIKTCIKENNDTTYINKLILSFDDQIIDIGFTAKGKVATLKVNESNFNSYCDNLRTINTIGLFPRIRELLKSEEPIDVFGSHYRQGILFFNQFYKLLKSKNRKNTSDNTIRRLLIKLGIGSKNEVLKNIFDNTISLKYLQKQIANWNTFDKDFIDFNDLLIATRISSILDYIEHYIVNSIMNFSYVAPLRATAQRYYRRQDLAISEVDFQGQNLAMFIDNMSTKILENFQSWVSEHFGFYPYTKSSEGHISLRIIDSISKEDYNIADRGFGYSQILPVITLLWSVVTSENKIFRRDRIEINSKILAIEQPELHLHPKLQAQLTHAFLAAIKLAKKRGIILKLIIETHSQTIVNTLGHEIAEKNFSPEDASIVLFENNQSKSCCSVNLVHYNKEGYLENWPIGFFEPQN
ncbi:MAG: AAA family ATPase [Bacteroidetes bacterium]|nr:AAA family ATPase [Bacteroidota bacterium]